VASLLSENVYEKLLTLSKIPGIAVIGPIFRPVIQGSIEITSELDFTYGFGKLAVPLRSSRALLI